MKKTSTKAEIQSNDLELTIHPKWAGIPKECGAKEILLVIPLKLEVPYYPLWMTKLKLYNSKASHEE